MSFVMLLPPLSTFGSQREYTSFEGTSTICFNFLIQRMRKKAMYVSHVTTTLETAGPTPGPDFSVMHLPINLSQESCLGSYHSHGLSRHLLYSLCTFWLFFSDPLSAHKKWNKNLRIKDYKHLTINYHIFKWCVEASASPWDSLWATTAGAQKGPAKYLQNTWHPSVH